MMKPEKIAWLILELAEQLSMQVKNNAVESYKLEKWSTLTRGHGYTKTEIIRTIDLMRNELMQLKRMYK